MRKCNCYTVILLIIFSKLNYGFSQERVYKKILTGFPLNLSLEKLEDTNSTQIILQIAEGLVRYDGNTIIPGLAEKWSISGDGKKYNFTLKRNIKFSDGSNISAYDFKEILLNQLTKDSIFAKELTIIKGAMEILDKKVNNLSGIQIKNETELTIELTSAYPPFIHLLASPQMSILNKKSLELLRNKKIAKVQSSGPYVIQEINNKEIRLTRNVHYYNHDIFFNEIHYYVAKNKETALNILNKEKLHDIFPYTVDDSKLNIYQMKKISTYTPGSWYLLLNLNDNLIKNINLRKILRQHFDKYSFLEQEKLPKNYAAYGMIPRGFLGHIRKNQPFLIQNEKNHTGSGCLKLKPCSIEILTPYGNSNHLKNAFDLSSLKKNNINLKFSNMDRKIWYKKFTNADYQITLVGNNVQYPDTLNMVKYLSNDKYHPGLNIEQITHWIKKASIEMNKKIREQYFFNIEEDLHRQVGIIPVYHGLNPYAAINKRIQGLKLNIFGLIFVRIADLSLKGPNK